MGSEIESGRPAQGGYTPAESWSLALADGRRIFAKGGADTAQSPVASRLRRERRAYEDISEPFMPALLGWHDDGRHALLLLEDLSEAEWPPPWRAEQIAAVRSTLEEVARTRPPVWAEDIEERERTHLSGWLRVRDDPDPFLSLGFCDERWLRKCLPALIESAESAQLGGGALVHFDVRSDNLCFVNDDVHRRVMLVDWNGCGRGNPLLDIMSWLPSLHSEGGPAPWEVVEESEGFAALLSGYWAAQAGLPPTGSTGARQLQLACLRSALPWAIRELRLPAPPTP